MDLVSIPVRNSFFVYPKTLLRWARLGKKLKKAKNYKTQSDNNNKYRTKAVPSREYNGKDWSNGVKWQKSCEDQRYHNQRWRNAGNAAVSWGREATKDLGDEIGEII